jgi:hypothetical protein
MAGRGNRMNTPEEMASSDKPRSIPLTRLSRTAFAGRRVLEKTCARSWRKMTTRFQAWQLPSSNPEVAHAPRLSYVHYTFGLRSTIK